MGERQIEGEKKRSLRYLKWGVAVESGGGVIRFGN